MKSYKGLSAIFLILLLASCSSENKDKSATTAPIVEKTPTFVLKKQAVNSSITLPAELTGFRQVDLYAKVNSYIKSLKVDIGSDVREGQLLVELEAPEISAQLAAAESRLSAQQAIYTASNSTYQRILETSKVEGTISKNDLEMALSRKNTDQAQLQANRAAYREVQVMKNYLQIRAPFSGKVTSRNLNVGAYVAQGGQVPLLTVQDNKKLRLAVSIPDAYTSYLKTGDELAFRITSLKGEKFTAKISRMAGALDSRLRSQRIELDVANNTKVLLPGMIAEVLLPLKSNKDIFMVPSAAVITNSEGTFIIRSKNGKAERIKVDLGLESNDKVEAFSDLLADDDILVAKANDELRDGSPIR